MPGAAFAALLIAAAGPAAAAGRDGAVARAPGRHAQMVRGSVTVDDYPRSARREPGGTTRLHFDVGANGRVGRCLVTASSGSSLLDAQSCRIVSRWRFRPARDASGRPAPETLAAAFTWTPPDNIRLDPPRPIAEPAR
jgi:protein TonB